jgi:hypothetical protein
MSKSPLSGAFSGSSEPAKKKKKNGAILLIAGIALTSSIGGVFAANSITINSGAAIQFGQGVAATNTCDDGLTTSITQSFDDANNAFLVDDVIVGGIDTTACSETTLRVGLVDENGAYIDSYTVVRPASETETTDRADRNIDAGSVKKVTVTTENAG